MKYPPIGTVSHGTMRTEGLLDSFSCELESLARANGRFKEFKDLIVEARSRKADEETLQALFDALDELAPPFCYFGAHPGDGSDYGFWPHDADDIEPDETTLKVSDLSEIPRGFTGEVFLVNDHGNVTFYKVTRGRRREVWSCT